MARIVIVDDDPTIVALVEETLEGHELLVSHNGLDGLALVQARKPDLVILDVTMPGLAGTTVCGRIKNDPATAHIPVIMLTGWGTVGDVEEGFAAKANDYIVKPFQPRALKAKVEGLLAGGMGAKPAQ